MNKEVHELYKDYLIKYFTLSISYGLKDINLLINDSRNIDIFNMDEYINIYNISIIINNSNCLFKDKNRLKILENN